MTVDVAALLAATPPPSPWVKSISVPCFGGRTSAGNTLTDVSRIARVCVGGFELRAKVTLERPAIAPYVHIYVSSTDITHAPPTPIRIYEGQTEGTILIRSTPVAVDTPVTIFAWTIAEDRKSDSFALVPPSITKIELTPLSLAAGNAAGNEVHGTLTFNGPPANATAVRATITSTLGQVTPSSAYLPVNTLTLPFVVKGFTPVENLTASTVTATTGPVSRTASFDVRPPELMEWSEASCHVPCLCYTACRRRLIPILDGNAPAAGVALKIESNKPDLLKVPSTVFIQPGRHDAEFDAEVPTVVSSETSATVTASHGPRTLTVGFEIKPPKKGDLMFEDVTFKDQYGRVITKIPDSNPVEMCALISACGGTDSIGFPIACGSHEPIGAVMSVDYTNNSGVGRSSTVPLDFGSGASLSRVCTPMPGLANPGDYYDIKLLLDTTDVINERTEGNNDKAIRIYR